jgi:hypothetical protein
MWPGRARRFGMIRAVRASALVPLLALLGYGVAFAAAALGLASPLAFDDHPGQLYRAWHAVRLGFAPWAWNGGWWAGYPELQFYPPALAYAVALLHRASLEVVSVPAAYQALLWVAYLGPGLTAFALLARLTGSGWTALPGAFAALTLSAGVASGVEGGIRWGMVSARLGWALLPLVPLALVPWIEGRQRLPRAVAPLVAGLGLTHPAHLPTAVAFVLAGALAATPDRRRRARAALLGLGLAAALTAFWTLPLLLRLPHTRALAWGSLATGPAAALTQPLPLALVALALLARAAIPEARFPRAAALVARMPWIMALVVAADALIAEPLGVRWLPADRVADGAWMALVLAAGLGAGSLIGRLPAARRLAPAPGSIAVVLALALLALPGSTLTLWPRAGDWPTEAAVERGFRLPALWAQLRTAPEGRVLIARSGLPLAHGRDWYRPHTHITALTPLRSGRPIVHGTFTHPSPVAAFVYRGHPEGGAIRALAERLDGLAIFGRPFADLDPPAFNDAAERLGISSVLVFDEDLAARDFMDGNGAFARRPSSPPFLLYARRAATPIPRETGPGRWQLPLEGGPGEWVSARMAYYPLWRAAQGGRALAVREGGRGELEVRLAAAGRPVDLTYRAGWPERAGLAVSAGAALLWLGGLAGERWRRPLSLRPAGRS